MNAYLCGMAYISKSVISCYEFNVDIDICCSGVDLDSVMSKKIVD